jgi:hypothetical protein
VHATAQPCRSFNQCLGLCRLLAYLRNLCQHSITHLQADSLDIIALHLLFYYESSGADYPVLMLQIVFMAMPNISHY